MFVLVWFGQHGMDQQTAILVTQTGLSILSSAYKIVENSDQYWRTHITTLLPLS